MMRHRYEFVQRKIGWNIRGCLAAWKREKFLMRGNVIELSKNEFIILRVLFEKQGDVRRGRFNECIVE